MSADWSNKAPAASQSFNEQQVTLLRALFDKAQVNREFDALRRSDAYVTVYRKVVHMSKRIEEVKLAR